MNKIKVMYDVVKKLKEKEVFKGTLAGEIKKDQVKLFGLAKEFEKDTAQGQVKAKISTEWDFAGKKGRHESSTEFHTPECAGTGMHHHHFMRHGHHFDHHPGIHGCCGVKGKLDKIAFVLNLFNNIKVDEEKDGRAVLSLTVTELPEDVKNHLKAHLDQKINRPEEGEKGCVLKELAALEEASLEVKVMINPNSEIEKIVLAGQGKQKDAQNGVHDLSLGAEINLVW
ncbi:hypothetical protein [Candidatus Formimonas warabiya]|uniref:Uncharacterized protein n=1 Tax=Formimonas warabiya TaxID=1761012 RepID=A0A3G1L260_FORW1|nr:hypothetical protein [Candidatus Formimonas warabiya]ATW28741.1 hypothetical protein DCMF_18990 [Candidatus Formimonas warabiya]